MGKFLLSQELTKDELANKRDYKKEKKRNQLPAKKFEEAK
jgi:hypothetical protein